MRVRLSVLRDAKGRAIEKPKAVNVTISLDHDGGEAFGFREDSQFGTFQLFRAHVSLISAEGFKITGLEKLAQDALRFQEWWCVPADTPRYAVPKGDQL